MRTMRPLRRPPGYPRDTLDQLLELLFVVTMLAHAVVLVLVLR
jgi:hypothetical protein